MKSKLNGKVMLNNKGFTLVEVMAVVVILLVLGMIAIPSVMSIINTSRNSSYDIIVKDITVASIQLFEEIENVGNTLYHYDINGRTNNEISINGNILETNLQTLAGNGFLSVDNEKKIINPKTKEDMGTCKIIIEKNVDSITFNTSYTIENNDSNENCPLTSEYENALR